MPHPKKIFSVFSFKKSRMQNCFLLLTVILTVSGCLGRRDMPVRYYILDYPASLQINIDDVSEPIPKSCLVNNVEIYPAYSTNQIALRENTHEIRYFAFNQWAVRPEQSLTAIIANFLNDQNIFSSVSTTIIHLETDYILETTVHHLQLIEEDNDYHAHLNLIFRLTDGQTGQELLDHKADRKELLAEKNLNLFASTISGMFIEELEIFTNSILADLR